MYIDSAIPNQKVMNTKTSRGTRSDQGYILVL